MEAAAPAERPSYPPMSAHERLQQARAIFDAYDKDHSGFIDAAEMEELLDGEGFADVDTAMVRSYDVDGNGNFSFDEFVQLHNRLLHSCAGGGRGDIILSKVSV